MLRLPAIVLLLGTLSVAAITAQNLSIDLERFLDLVERNSLDLTRARAEQRQAGTEQAIARAQTRPSLNAQAGYTRNLMQIESSVPAGADVTGDPAEFAPLIFEERVVSNDNEISAGVSLQQLLFDLRVFRALEASRRFTSMTAVTYEATRQAVVTAAKKLFYRTILLAEVLEVRRESEQLAFENYQDVQRRHDAGVATPLDLLRAELNWRTTVPETSQADRNLQIALSNLKSIAGIEPGVSIRLEGTLESYPQMPRIEPLESVLTERPDYQALRGMRSLREIEVAAGRAEFYPRLSGSVSWGWSAADDGFNFDDGTASLTAGLQLQLPLYSGGGRAARLQRSRLEVEKVESEIEQKINDVRTELRNVELTLLEADQRIEMAQQALETAELAYSITETSVDAGVSTQLELKDARVSLVQARLTYYSAVFDYLSAYFDWQQTTGRGADGL